VTTLHQRRSFTDSTPLASSPKSFVIARRFCGPPGFGQGGYVAGVIAALQGGGVEVTLRRPVPLGVRLFATQADAGLLVRHREEIVAEARPVVLDADIPPNVDWAELEEAEQIPYLGAEGFETCFVCGPARSATESMGVFPRRIGTRAVAARLRPPAWAADARGRLRSEFVSAVLDCPTGFAVDLSEWRGMAVTGRLAVSIDEAPRLGNDCMVLGWLRGVEGRKIFTSSALLSRGGEVLARATAVWIGLPGDPKVSPA
jgi:hypothetical protein